MLCVGTCLTFHACNSNPVERALPKDAELEVKLLGLQMQVELKKKLEPYIHRKGAKVLRKNLPPVEDFLLYLEPSNPQQELMRFHKRLQKCGFLSNNFFRYVLADISAIRE